jgi:hypothetical protein
VVFQAALPPIQYKEAANAEGAAKWLSNATEKAAVMEA